MIKDFLKALKIKFKNDKTKSEDTCDYNPEFVASIERSIQDAKEGKFIRVKLDDIWK